MIVFTLALYGIPIALALVALGIGVLGLRFYITEVLGGGGAGDYGGADHTRPAEDPDGRRGT